MTARKKSASRGPASAGKGKTKKAAARSTKKTAGAKSGKKAARKGARKAAKKAVARSAAKASAKTAGRKAAASPKPAADRPVGSAARATKKKPGATAAKESAAAPARGKVAKPSPRPAKAADTPRQTTAKQASDATTAGGRVSVADVHMGHVFSLRPRVHTSFNPESFREAKRQLAETPFASLEEAARAVAEKASEISRGGPERHPFGGTRRRGH